VQLEQAAAGGDADGEDLGSVSDILGESPQVALYGLDEDEPEVAGPSRKRPRVEGIVEESAEPDLLPVLQELTTAVRELTKVVAESGLGPDGGLHDDVTRLTRTMSAGLDSVKRRMDVLIQK